MHILHNLSSLLCWINNKMKNIINFLSKIKMAEIAGKRKARDMNGSNASDHDEPDIKAKKTNELRRRSSFARGKFCKISLCYQN